MNIRFHLIHIHLSTFYYPLPLQKVTALESELSKQQNVNEELSTELREAGQYAELNHTINDLDSQLQTLRRSEQQAQQRVKELEEELRSLKSLEQVCIWRGRPVRLKL